MGCAPSGGTAVKAPDAQLYDEAGKGANWDKISKLIDSNANINAKLHGERTALHHAARNGKVESVRCLLALRADINIMDKDKVKPLGLAEWQKHGDVAALLREAQKGKRPALPPEALNKQLFDVAEKGGSWDKINPLISARANVNAKVKGGRTALHTAARHGKLESVRCLLALKADVTIKDTDKVMALGLAEWQKHHEVAKLLRQAAKGSGPAAPGAADGKDKASSSKKAVTEVMVAPAASAPGWDPSGPLAPFPAYWGNRDASHDFVELVPILGQLEQFQQLLDTTFVKVTTRDRGGAELPAKLQVALVQRVENRNLWQRYSGGRKRVMERRSGRCTALKNMSGGAAKTLATDGGFAGTAAVEGLEAGINEVLLFHGTSPESALGIAKTGFDLSRSGAATGTLYGPGVYAAEMCSKSDEYSSQSTEGLFQGLHALLLCRVVLGEMLTMTVGGESVYPVVKAALDSGSYDAVLGDRKASSGTYREFVVYREDCLYPEYVILYTRLSQSGATLSNNAADNNQPSEPTS